jgi:hypothetical protein
MMRESISEGFVTRNIERCTSTQGQESKHGFADTPKSRDALPGNKDDIALEVGTVGEHETGYCRK